MIPITDEERRGWQRRAARNLVDLLMVGAEKDLPLLHWHVTPTATIVGDCQIEDQQARRDAFERWAAVLRGVRTENQVGSTTYLRVKSEGWGGDGGSLVVVTARITEEPESGSGDPT